MEVQMTRYVPGLSNLSVLVAALTVAACTTVAPNAGWSIPPELKSVRMLDGYPLTYQETGSGVPVVLIHGALTDYRSWFAQAPEFSRQFRVINVNLRRYYPEPWGGNGPGFDLVQQADDVAALIRDLRLGKAHIIGHSRGGAVAFQVASRHPDVSRTLVLADASLFSLVPATPESIKADAEGRAITERLRANHAKGDLNEAARDYVDAFSGSGTWAGRTPEQKKVFFDNIGTGLAEDSRKWPKVACDDVAGLTMPVLVVNGESSPKRFVEIARAARNCNPRIAPLVTIKQASHIMNRQQPAEFNRAVMNFLTGN
jgi:esterase